jgi:hypothetical protein
MGSGEIEVGGVWMTGASEGDGTVELDKLDTEEFVVVLMAPGENGPTVVEVMNGQAV